MAAEDTDIQGMKKAMKPKPRSDLREENDALRAELSALRVTALAPRVLETIRTALTNARDFGLNKHDWHHPACVAASKATMTTDCRCWEGLRDEAEEALALLSPSGPQAHSAALSATQEPPGMCVCSDPFVYEPACPWHGKTAPADTGAKAAGELKCTGPFVDET